MKVRLLTCRKCGGTKLETERVETAGGAQLYWWCTRCQLCILSVWLDVEADWSNRTAVVLSVKER